MNDQVLIGFSEKVNDPAIRAALKKNRRATAIFAFVLILAPILVASYFGIREEKGNYILYGAIVSMVFLVFNLIAVIKKKSHRQWDGVVLDKYTKVRQERSSSDEDNSISTYTAFIIKIKKDRGGHKLLEEREYNHPYYEYLNIGDRVRYHPQFAYYYEKFDKSRDSYLLCPICSTKNNIERDRCVRCGVPVIK